MLKLSFQKTQIIQDGGMFSWKFKMSAIFEKLYIMSLSIYRCIELSNTLNIDRDTIFFKRY